MTREASQPPTPAELERNPNLRGQIRIAPNGRTFEYADGTPFFLLADTLWVPLETWESLRFEVRPETVGRGSIAQAFPELEQASLLENASASISQHTMEYLVEESRRIDAYRNPLVHRHDLDPNTLLRLGRASHPALGLVEFGGLRHLR